MAKYDITNLNYIATGLNRCFINMDTILDYELYDIIHLLCAETQTSGYDSMHNKNMDVISSLCVDIGTELGDGYWYPTEYILKGSGVPLAHEKDIENIILNEQQKRFIEANPNLRKYIRLYLSCCTEELRLKIRQFNLDREHVNCTYVADISNYKNDKNNLTCDGREIKNLYDILDLTILSRNQHSNVNYELNYTDRKHELYLPQLMDHPIGFCQSLQDDSYYNDAIVMTLNIASDPVMMHSDLLSNRFEDNHNDGDYYTDLHGKTLKTYLYKTAEERNYISGSFEDFMTPVRNYCNVKRSYILDMPIDSGTLNISEIPEYDSGEFYYNRMHLSKSAYDAMYDMNMLSVDRLNNCRTYCGIGCVGGKPYIKYYDNINYNALSTESNISKVENVMTETANTVGNNKFDSTTMPYLKIEFITPADYTTAALHKSNTFTVNILSTGIQLVEEQITDDEGNVKDDKLDVAEKLKTLKFDITNAVRQIAESITPANTQLIDVKFGDK